jgi:hypothetical protein
MRLAGCFDECIIAAPRILAKWLFHFGDRFFDLAQAGGCSFQTLLQLFNLRF